MIVLRYDWQDIFYAASLGLRLRKWIVALPGILVGFLWWGIFGYLALISHGLPVSRIWMGFGPIPWPTLSTLGSGVTPFLWFVADFGFWAAVLLTGAALSRITFEQLRGNDFTTWSEAWTFSLRRWKPIIVSPFALFMGAGTILLTLFLISLLVNLWGPLAGILYIVILPAVVAGLYLGLTALIGIFYGPSIVASSNSLTLETLFETISLTSNQGRRGWLYAVISFALAGVYTVAFGLLLGLASLLSTWILDYGHAGIAGSLLKRAMFWSPRICDLINGVPGMVDSAVRALGIQSAAIYPHAVLSEPISLGVWFMIIWLFLLFFLLVAQFITTMSTCCTTAYIVLRLKKDEQNLLEEDLGEL